jgi:methionyl-tRNA formyltransferase
MKMDAGLDTGDILLQHELKIREGETAPELIERLSHTGAHLLVRTLQQIGEIEPRKQDDLLASYAPMLTREDGRIDWNLSSPAIDGRIRGFQPFPSSFTTYKGQRITIWKAKAAGAFPSNEVLPGTVISIENKLLVVACGNETTLVIEEIQPEGKRRMPAADFINGSRVQIGDRFGEVEI